MRLAAAKDAEDLGRERESVSSGIRPRHSHLDENASALDLGKKLTASGLRARGVLVIASRAARSTQCGEVEGSVSDPFIRVPMNFLARCPAGAVVLVVGLCFLVNVSVS